ncbi:MAG: pentapeptide repeat-containing protein [Treponema sp.]|nr:pentapeptide repeat-containing protein [Treponema sp.]
MFLSNLTDKHILQDSICSKKISESQIVNCVLDEMGIFDNAWEQVTVNNSNINEAAFHNISFFDCMFFRSSLMNTKFDSCSINSITYSGDTLIKATWNKCKISQMTIKQSTMQRATIKNCIVQNSCFSDFEGIYATLKDSCFRNCRFENTFESGMNGFSGAKFENCIFLNCIFDGYPLRGMQTSSCVFINCIGEITDDAECINTYSNSFSLNKYCLPMVGIELMQKEEAQKFLKGKFQDA